MIPYALPFERPYVTARGHARAARDAALRLITDEGLVGLGEAVPLALRGGADLAASSAGSARARAGCAAPTSPTSPATSRTLAAVDAFIHTVAGRRIPAPAKAAIEMAVFDLAGKASRPAAVVAARRRASRSRSPATRPWSPDRPTRSPPTPSAGRARGFDTFKLKLGDGDDVAQVRAVRERRRRRRADPGRRERRLERRRGARRAADDRAARDRARRAARRDHRGMAEVTGGHQRPRRRRRDASPARQGRRAGRSASAPATWRR